MKRRESWRVPSRQLGLRRELRQVWVGAVAALLGLGGVGASRAEVPCGCASVPDLFASTRGAVVGLTADKGRRPREFESFFQVLVEQESSRRSRLTLGSGAVVDSRGIVLTSYHVVREAQRLSVAVPSVGVVAASLVVFDEKSDLALVRLESRAGGYAALEIARGAELRVGETVVALGSPLGLDASISVGVVSALGRGLTGAGLSYRYSDLIQTDAAIHPGNSGGPLLNLRGQIVGINTAVVPALAGLGFAVPAERARSLLARARLRTDGPG